MNNQSYNAPDGAYWPDVYAGVDEYFGVDCSTWLTNENDTLTSVEWTLPSGVTSSDEYEDGNTALIKLNASSAGTYTIKFKLNSSESGRTQIHMHEIKLKVL